MGTINGHVSLSSYQMVAFSCENQVGPLLHWPRRASRLEVHVPGVELQAEVVHRLVHVLGQRVLFDAANVVAVPPDPLHELR